MHNLALIVWTSFLAFIVAPISQAVSAGLPSRRSLGLSLPLLLVCLAALESALFAEALWLFLVGTVVGGIAVGLIFRGGLSEINRLAESPKPGRNRLHPLRRRLRGPGPAYRPRRIISQLTGTVGASVYTATLPLPSLSWPSDPTICQALTSTSLSSLEVLDCDEGLLIVDIADLTFINLSGWLVLEGASRYAVEKEAPHFLHQTRAPGSTLFALGGSEVAIVDGEASSHRKARDVG